MGVLIREDLLVLLVGVASSFLVCRSLLCSATGLAKEMSSPLTDAAVVEGWKYFSSILGLLLVMTMSNMSFSLCLAAGLTPVLLYVLVTGLESGTMGSMMSSMLGLMIESVAVVTSTRRPVAGDEGLRLLKGEDGLGRDLLATWE